MLRSYFSCLFKALAATHAIHIVHRDVKPANFLYDFYTAEGVLCDFGLAQDIGEDEWYEWTGECLHSLCSKSTGGLAGRAAARAILAARPDCPPGIWAGLHGARLTRPLSLYTQSQQMITDWEPIHAELRAQGPAGKEEITRRAPWTAPPADIVEVYNQHLLSRDWYKNWNPASIGTSSTTGGKGERVGYLIEDRR